MSQSNHLSHKQQGAPTSAGTEPRPHSASWSEHCELSAPPYSFQVTSSDCQQAQEFQGLVGRSPGMRRLFDHIRLISSCFRILTIEGEDGTGKSAIARVLHELSPWAREPFVPCLASSFLQTRSGAGESWDAEALECARCGMLVLDRVHELDESQQSGLFRFLLWFENQRHVEPDHAPRRLVVITHTPLRRLAGLGGFHIDLCSRLTAVRLVVPPLRERREDIPLLAHTFASRFSQTYAKRVCGLGQGTLAPLLRYSWPGNVRELESVIVAASLQTEGGWIRPIDLPVLQSPSPPLPFAGPTASPSEPAPPEDLSLEGAIRRHIARVLEETHGNKLRAAAFLGISRSTLYRMLASYPVISTRGPAGIVSR